jgi:hypothetical protein
MPLTYTAPPALGSIVTSEIRTVIFDLIAQTVSFSVTHMDGSGTVLQTERLTMNTPAGTQTNVKNAAYAFLQARRGNGTVT